MLFHWVMKQLRWGLGKQSTCLMLCLLPLLVACSNGDAAEGQATGSVETAEEATEEIERILDLYERAVNEADENLLLEIWARQDEVSFVTPAGRLHSWEALEGFWRGFLRDGYSERRLSRKNVSIQTSGDTAWAVFDFNFKGTSSDGQSVEVSGWETQIYRKTDQGWRIAHVHYSVPYAPPQTAELVETQ